MKTSTSNNGFPALKTSVTDAGCTTRVTLNLDYTNSGNLYKITKISGSFTRLDYGFTISNKMVRVANLDNGESGSDVIKTFYPSGSTFKYSGFESFVNYNKPPMIVGGYAKCDVKRTSDLGK